MLALKELMKSVHGFLLSPQKIYKAVGDNPASAIGAIRLITNLKSDDTQNKRAITGCMTVVGISEFIIP